MAGKYESGAAATPTRVTPGAEAAARLTLRKSLGFNVMMSAGMIVNVASALTDTINAVSTPR